MRGPKDGKGVGRVLFQHELLSAVVWSCAQVLVLRASGSILRSMQGSVLKGHFLQGPFICLSAFSLDPTVPGAKARLVGQKARFTLRAEGVHLPGAIVSPGEHR